MTHLFTQEDAWTGGNIDALMFFGAATVDDAIVVSNALWEFPRLAGPYRYPHLEPAQQPLVEHPAFAHDGCEQLFGVFTNHDGTQSNFAHTTIFDEDGLWVYAGVTVGSLPASWNVGAYPIEDGSPTTWLPSLYDDLRLITRHVNESKPILGATYGWLTIIDCDILLKAIGGTIPKERWGPLDVWDNGRCECHPPTCFDAPTRFDL